MQCTVQCNKVYSDFECYEMDVLKYKIGPGNKTKITFRLNKNYPISSLRVKKIGLMQNFEDLYIYSS